MRRVAQSTLIRRGVGALRGSGTRPQRRCGVFLLVRALQGLGGPDFSPVGARERSEDQQVFFGLEHHLFDFGDLGAERGGDDLELLDHVRGVGWGEDRVDRCADHLGVPPVHDSENLAHGMQSASLPVRADENRGDCFPEPWRARPPSPVERR